MQIALQNPGLPYSVDSILLLQTPDTCGKFCAMSINKVRPTWHGKRWPMGCEPA